MYIKEVEICGFRSFRFKTRIGGLSPKHNVIIGRNGSGKSNFFCAIQFVLSEEFTGLNANQRQHLIYEGAEQTYGAYVEIVFDNADRRLPFETDEVKLRRHIGMMKDQFSVNGNVAQKSEINSLLETAGFSQSNPYYIVKQGRISEITTSSDAIRLNILRDIAGTRTYDLRKKDALKDLKKTEYDIERFEELLAYITKKSETLAAESEHLRGFLKWDKMKRSIEYTLYNVEIEEAKKVSSEFEKRYRERYGEMENIRDGLARTTMEVAKLKEERKRLQNEMSRIQTQKESLEEERNELMIEREKLKFNIGDLNQTADNDSQSKSATIREIDQVNQQIKETQETLDKIIKQYEELKKAEDANAETLADLKQKRETFVSKQQRSARFSNQKQRDEYINGEITKIDKIISDKSYQIKNLKNDVNRDSSKKAELEKKITQHTQEADEAKEEAEKEIREFYSLKKEKQRVDVERSELWRTCNSLTHETTMLKEEKVTKEKHLSSIIGKAFMDGWESIMEAIKILEGKGVEIRNKYHGMLIDLIECTPALNTCVEVVAGKQLFFHVVDNDKTANQILKVINQRKLPGDIHFMSLANMDPKEHDYPNEEKCKDFLPLMNKIDLKGRFRDDPKFSKPLLHVFGKTLLCRNLEVASETARIFKFNCITTDGDQVFHSGKLSGGYFNPKKVKIIAYKALGDISADLAKKFEELEKNKNKLESVEQKYRAVIESCAKLEEEAGHSKSFVTKNQTDISILKQECDHIDKALRSKLVVLKEYESSLNTLQATKRALEIERQEPFSKHLSKEEQKKLNDLNKEIHELSGEQRKISEKRLKVEQKKIRLESKIKENLRRRKDELEAALQEVSSEHRRLKLDAEKEAFKAAQKKIIAIDREIEQINEKYEDLTPQLEEVKEKFEIRTEEGRDLNEQADEMFKYLDKVRTRLEILEDKIESYKQKLAKLGTIPNDTDARYSMLNSRQLHKKLLQCNRELQKFGDINQKALIQYKEAMENKEQFTERRKDLEAGLNAIHDLMNSLEHKKYEAIQNTFRQVSVNFSDIFSKLVDGGKGRLEMLTRKGRGNDGAGDSQSSVDTQSSGGISQTGSIVQQLDDFSGVAIRVSFTGSANEMKDMVQLSGGQKSLVALAFILAIQKCDPAPFYLFDEVDQALDPDHRKAVSDLIHEFSRNCQFILITFRPELLEKADKYFGVKYKEKVTYMGEIKSEEAKEFVQTAHLEPETNGINGHSQESGEDDSEEPMDAE